MDLVKVQFEVTKQHFGEDGFRNAFKASSGNILFQNKSWSLRVNKSGELMLNVKRERPFKCIAFQSILHLRLSNSEISISTHLESPLVTTKSITVYSMESLQKKSIMQDRYFVKEK